MKAIDIGVEATERSEYGSRTKRRTLRLWPVSIQYQMGQRHDISWIKAYAVAIASLLSGAAVVHNIFKPDLVRLSLKLDMHCWVTCAFAV